MSLSENKLIYFQFIKSLIKKPIKIFLWEIIILKYVFARIMVVLVKYLEKDI